jgi:uncharacterized protein (DUF1684 family)
MKRRVLLLLVFLGNICFQSVFAQASNYQQEIESWHQKRIQDLKSPNGWVNLAGLFWLKEGKNSLGSAPTNDIVFKHPNMPALAGYFYSNNQEVTWTTDPAARVSILDSLIWVAEIFKPGNFRAPILALNNFRWNIIQRDNKIGVRFRDLESDAVKKFSGINRYPVDSNWRIAATLEIVKNSTISITNVLGQTNNQPTPGKLVFTINNTTYRLDALEETPGELFIIFGDATSGKETYPAGRFLYAHKPEPGGMTYLDFNKAYNPPCAFSIFATCPLPPKQNILPFALRAGEKTFGE